MLSYWIPKKITLPFPDACYESNLSKLYIYSSLKLVVKIHYHIESCNRELGFYAKWLDLQGHGIPRLLAKGNRLEDSLPVLFLSYEGTRLNVVSDEERYVRRAFIGISGSVLTSRREILEGTVLGKIHKAGWHHHDLAPRNIVCDPAGRLSIIDFGEAQECKETGCDDAWVM